MNYIIPSSIKKTIRFPRLSSKNVLSYEIYTKVIDNTYRSGIRVDLIDTIVNPLIPSPFVATKEYTYTENCTWRLPKDIYMDRDHKIRVFVDGIQVSNLYYTINKVAGLITVNKTGVIIKSDSIIKIEYYQDIIEKSYMLDQECEIIIKPIMIDSYHYGKHNVIL